MRRTLLFICVSISLILLSISTQAQQRKVEGIVLNTKNKPLEGATITLKSLKKSVISKSDGNFEINAPEGKAVLTISFIGYKSKTISVDVNEKFVTVELSESENNQLNDVVIVGVQSQSKRKTTAAVSTVLSKDIENLPAPSVDQLLQGRVAGLNVQIESGEPGVTPSIVVRGNSRINTQVGNNPDFAQARALSSPLYVIDGVPTNPEDISNGIDVTGTNYLAGININDIERVDVQKDASATAAWGSRGANGVIYITTKRGRSSKPEFRVNAYTGITKQPQLLKTFTGAEERQQKLNIINQYATPSQLANLPQLLTDQFNPSFNNATDWQGLFYRTGSVNNIDATVSAATDNVNYRVSANYYDEKGIIEAFGFRRYSMRGNFDFKINPKLNTQLIVSFSKSDRQRGRKYYGNSDDNTPVSGSNQPTSFYRLTAFDSANFTGIYSKLRNKNINDYYSVSLTSNYSILPSLRYTFQGAADISTSNRDYFQPSNIDEVAAKDPNAPAQPSYAESDKGTYNTYFLSNTLNFIKKIEAGRHVHNIAVTASQQFNADVINSNNVWGYNVPSNDIRVVSGIPQSDIGGSSDYAADGLLSLSGQVQYDFDNKYLLYGSYRGDASSRFGANTKWGYFPAAGIGWIVSDEKFLQKQNIISFLKIRASYGISGNQSPDLYAPYNSYIIPGTYGGSTAIEPSYTNGLTKNNLTWTKTSQKDLGVDVQLFNNRINFTVDAYEKLSKDDYYDFQLPFYTGFQSINFNAHDLWVDNRGYDITLGARILSHNSPFQWNTQITISHNRNAIAKLPNHNRTFVIDDYYGVSRVFAVGQPIYEMFQLKYLGVYNNQSEIPFNSVTGQGLTYFKGNHKVVPGDPIWEDVNKIGDVWPDEDNGAAYGDRIPTGDPNPKYTGGWVNDFSYKNFNISILSIFTWKRTIVNTFFQQQISNIVGGYSSSINTFADSRLPDLSGINYWTPQKAKSNPNYKANFPSINPFGPSYYQYIPISSMFNEDGSYFKIKSITINYTIPESLIKKIKVKGINVYGVIDDVLTLKNSSMPNPELVDQLGIYTGGLYPTPTRYTLGADVRF